MATFFFNVELLDLGFILIKYLVLLLIQTNLKHKSNSKIHFSILLTIIRVNLINYVNF